MSLTAGRSYLRARAKAIGLREWTDGFNIENIPSTIIDNCFFIQTTSGSGIKLNQHDQELNFSNTVRVFTKGRDAAGAIDSAVKIVEDLIIETLTAKNRLTQPNGIKNVALDSFSFDAFDQSNDNIVSASITFRVVVTLVL